MATLDEIKEARRQGAIDNMIENALRPGGTLDTLAKEHRDWAAQCLACKEHISEADRRIDKLEARQVDDRKALDTEIDKRIAEVWAGIDGLRKIGAQIAIGLGVGIGVALVGLLFKVAFGK